MRFFSFRSVAYAILAGLSPALLAVGLFVLFLLAAGVGVLVASL